MNPKYNKDLKISLIIPAYNEEKYIGECLSYALKNSKGKLLEIIVVDNASTDRTREIAEKYEGVRVVYEKEKGLTRARQRGYLESKGDILAYIDADTHMPEGWVDNIIKEFSENERLSCLSGPCFYYDLSSFDSVMSKIYWYIFTMPVYLLVGYMVHGAGFSIKRSVLDKMNGFDTAIEFYGEDTNIAHRAHAFGKVKFKFSSPMYASARRFKNEGMYKTTIVYAFNFFSEVFWRKPVTKHYKDFR